MRILILLAIIASFSAAAGGSRPAPKPTAAEDGVLAELNSARTNPKQYAGYIREFRKQIQDGMIVRGNVRITTQEGTSAVDEAIAFLEKQRPIGALRASKGLASAARDHANDQKNNDRIGHEGKDGSMVADRVNRYGKWDKTIGENIAYGFAEPRDIVMQLIIDDGVKSRGHRTNIFKSEYALAGIACGPHGRYREMCVIAFAGAYKDK